MRDCVFANVTYNGIRFSSRKRGLIQGTNMNVYDCIFSDLTFYNDDGNEFGLFGVRYQTSSSGSTASTSESWHVDNVLFKNIYANQSSLFYMSADALTAANEVKLTNVKFDSVLCDKGENNFIPIIGGYGGVVNGLIWTLENIEVYNAQAEMFFYLEGKNAVEIVNFSYHTQLFNPGTEDNSYSDYLLIFWVDSVASLDITLSVCFLTCCVFVFFFFCCFVAIAISYILLFCFLFVLFFPF